MGQWAFSGLRGDDVRRDPNEAELFKTEQTAEGEYAGTDALVREVLQNAVDARQGDNPVRVRLAVHEANNGPAAAKLSHFFARLKAPLATRQFEFDGQGVPRMPCRFLVVEDFGTRGLEGDTLLFHDPAPGDRTPQYFYWFWRNIGRSGKTGVDLGRWGLGKTVYRAASRVGCMFGFTIRQSDQRKLLMGQAVLHIHEHEGNEYKPEGYWCGSQNADGLPLPIEDALELEDFCREWRIVRATEPGLSVVVPFIPDELRADRLIQAVGVHFFTRILRGELEVEIAGPGIGEVKLDRAGLSAACKKIIWDGPARTKRHVAPPIEFARQCLDNSPVFTTEVLGKERVPEITDEIFPEPILHDLRRRFSACELIGIRVRLSLPRRVGPPQEGYLDAFLQRTPDGQRCDSYYVREGMTITKLNSQAGKRGVQSLVLADSGPLAVLLGDTEGPAHEDWDTSAERPDRDWKTWKGRVKFVRRIVDGLTELLTPPAAEPDFDLLSDFFSIERVGGTQRQREVGDKSKQSPKFPPLVSDPKWYQITSRVGGFTVSRNAKVPKPADGALRVAVAYDLPRGDPLKNWNPLDFTIGRDGLKPAGKGCKFQSVKGNVVLFRELADEFQVSIEGFDRSRDLFVRVDEVSTDEEVSHD